MRYWLFFLVAVFSVAGPILSSAAGGVRVVDGDTIDVNGVRIRLYGIDAPEAGQTCAKAGGGTWKCGKAAIAEMEDLVLNGQPECDDRGEDDYGRTLAVCRLGGLDVNAEMVRKGLAWSFRRYSHVYDTLEDAVHAKAVGVWQAPTETPWDYRARRWTKAVGEAPDKRCPIKGNIRDGKRIYHAPWSPWYDRTAINPKAGERWFCNEAEAIAAGWRAPYWGR